MKSFFFGFILMLLLIYGGPHAAKHVWDRLTNSEKETIQTIQRITK